MNGRNIRAARCIGVGMALMFALCTSAAVTVHTWVDAQGVRHYADAPPGDDSATQQGEIDIDIGPELAPGDADYYSISNQWQRLRAERDAQIAAGQNQRRTDEGEDDASPPPRDTPPHPVYYPNYYSLPPRFGPLYPPPDMGNGPPSPRNAKVNTPPPVWPRER